MLLFAYLMTRNSLWSGAVIRVFASVKDKDGGLIDTQLHQLMEDYRIDAEPIILFDDTIETIIEMSGKSSFVFLPIRIKDNQVLDVHGGPLLKLLPYLPMTAMVMAAQDIDLEAEPDTGVQGELAIAEDEFTEANEKYEAAQKESARMHKKSEVANERLAKSSKEHEEFSQILKDADQALKEEEDAFRREAKAKAKAEEAAKIFNGIRGHSTTTEDKTN